jgi:uncharacterized membrane protein YvlD (DUF360 family)
MEEPDRILYAIGLTAAIAALGSLIVQSPVQDYEWSIYAGLGPVFWIPFAVGLGFVGAGIISAVRTEGRWRFGLATLVLLLGMLYALPVARGYYQYGSGRMDVLLHLGITVTLMETGTLVPSDWYPMLHVQFTAYRYVGLSRRLVLNVIGVSFNAILVAGAYLYTREKIGDGRPAAVVALAVSAPVYGVFNRSLHPFMLSFMLLPLTFYTIHQFKVSSDGYIWSAVSLVFLTCVLLFHPFTAVYLAVWVGISLTLDAVCRRASRKGEKQGILSLLSDDPRTYLLSLLGVEFAAWYLLSFDRIVNPITTIIFGIVGNRKPTGAGSFGAARNQALQGTDLVFQFVESYGPQVLFIGAGATISLYVLQRTLRGVDYGPERLLRFRQELSLQVIAGGIIALGLVPTGLLLRPTRVIQYGLFACSLLIGTTVGGYVSAEEDDRTPRGLAILAVLCLLVAVPAGAMTVYAPNRHTTEEKAAGTEWVLQANHGRQPTASIGENYKTVAFHEGFSDALSAGYSTFSAEYPHRLGREHTRLGTIYRRQTFIVTKSRDRHIWNARHPSQWDRVKAYRSSDVDRLHTDPSAEKTFHSGGYAVWYVAEATVPGGT